MVKQLLSSDKGDLKGHYVVLEKKPQTQNLDIYNINEVLIQTQRYLFCP